MWALVVAGRQRRCTPRPTSTHIRCVAFADLRIAGMYTASQTRVLKTTPCTSRTDASTVDLVTVHVFGHQSAPDCPGSPRSYQVVSACVRHSVRTKQALPIDQRRCDQMVSDVPERIDQPLSNEALSRLTLRHM
jgi:hypothetical protein